MPHVVWAALGAHAQRICRHIAAPEGVAVPGAGAMHPLAARRAELSEGLAAIQQNLHSGEIGAAAKL
jgi:hypothetical protein